MMDVDGGEFRSESIPTRLLSHAQSERTESTHDCVAEKHYTVLYCTVLYCTRRTGLRLDLAKMEGWALFGLVRWIQTKDGSMLPVMVRFILLEDRNIAPIELIQYNTRTLRIQTLVFTI